MGDIQAFAQMAIFDRDMAAFFTKWIADVRDSQADDGRYPDMVPHLADPNKIMSGVPAWGDAGIVVPWRMYRSSADARLLDNTSTRPGDGSSSSTGTTRTCCGARTAATTTAIGSTATSWR